MNPAICRPSFEEVIEILKLIEKDESPHLRNAERFDVTIPGEMITAEGAKYLIRMRNVSHSGVGFFHYGKLEDGEVTVKLAVNTYKVSLKWCVCCWEDLYMSGGPILSIQNAIRKMEVKRPRPLTKQL